MAVTSKFIKELIETETEIEDISIKSRKRPLPELRFMAYDLCKIFCSKNTTLEQIGKTFDVDHSTVSNGQKQFNYIKAQPKINKDALDLYFKLTRQLREEINKHGVKKVLKSVEEVENEYRIKHIELENKYRSVINSLSRKLYNFRYNSVFKEIAGLGDDTLKDFEQRAEAFMIMNKNKV